MIFLNFLLIKNMEQNDSPSRRGRPAGQMFFRCSRCSRLYFVSDCPMNEERACKNCGANNFPERKCEKILIRNLHKLVFGFLILFSLQFQLTPNLKLQCDTSSRRPITTTINCFVPSISINQMCTIFKYLKHYFVKK